MKLIGHMLILLDFVNRNHNPDSSCQVLKDYATRWRDLDQTASVSITETIEEALDLARKIGSGDSGMQTLVTGSLHLVGGALSVLEDGV
jgi:folylpolyglutamate synthase/dihydropteroate synthase